MIRSLAIVGVSAACEQEARQLRVMCDAGDTIDGALELGRLVVGGIKPGVRAGPRVQQGRRRAQEALSARGVKSQVTRETEMREWIPSIRPTWSGSSTEIERQKSVYAGVVC